ncbi:hypothetical protein [Carnimonas bestiolae]|uniref:hypothetical protein n=1 Tax=Carnimonas bestiolae TaxID=3402172 RepID=UPI003EDB754D
MSSSRERPILFSGAMVSAILSGAKTQTRRVIKSPAKSLQSAGSEVIKYRPKGDSWYGDHEWSMRNAHGVWGDYTHDRFLTLCPHGQVGDRLWVRETFKPIASGHVHNGGGNVRYGYAYKADDAVIWNKVESAIYDLPDSYDSGHLQFQEVSWKPPIYMPRNASRITLEITSVRIERLQSLGADDARQEGIACLSKDGGQTYKYGIADRDGLPGNDNLGWHWRDWQLSSVDAFKKLWHQTNGTQGYKSWDANPWVWVIEFKRVDV